MEYSEDRAKRDWSRMEALQAGLAALEPDKTLYADISTLQVTVLTTIAVALVEIAKQLILANSEVELGEDL